MTRVLLVADEPWVVNDVKAALADRRYSITEVDDPRQVTSLLHDSAFDVVIVDMQVGTMGAMAVARAVRSTRSDQNPAPPVVVLLDRDADAFLARRAAATAWIRKPFGSAALRRAVDGVAAVTA